MSVLYYPVVLQQEDVGYSVRVPDLDGCYSQGDTLDEALSMTQEAVKKTLTIPSWLNDAAEAAHINFSSLLQSALKQQLHID